MGWMDVSISKSISVGVGFRSRYGCNLMGPSSSNQEKVNPNQFLDPEGLS